MITPSHCMKVKIFWGVLDSNLWLWRSRILEHSRRRKYVAHTWNFGNEYTGICSVHNRSWIFVKYAEYHISARRTPRVRWRSLCYKNFKCLRQGKKISVQEPEKSCYDLTAFRQLPLPQGDFHKNSPEVVLSEREDVSRSREKLKWLMGNRGNGHWRNLFDNL